MRQPNLHFSITRLLDCFLETRISDLINKFCSVYSLTYSMIFGWRRPLCRSGKFLTNIKTLFFSLLIQNITNGQLYQVWYDDPTSLKLRSDYAIKMSLRGVGMWTANDLDYSNSTQVGYTNVLSAGIFFRNR